MCIRDSAVLRVLERERLVEASARQGERLHTALVRELADIASVGDVRGRGLLQAVELVADPATRRAFPRAERVTERVLEACRAHGVLVYPGTGCADGVDGDLLLLGPPLVVDDAEVDEIAAGVAAGLRDVLGAEVAR